MNHVWGLFSHPDREMQVIKSENETVSHHYTHHVLLMAAIPVVCAFIGTTQIGWNFGDGNVLQLSLFTAFALAVLFYGVMLAGVAVDGTRHLVDGAKLSATAIACALYGFLPAMSRRRCF
ncbi:membrane protein [Salmonella enterica subsp. enterica]|nr:membrane protein [Salmonella enterica subsp. enterica] [Salmonella enterica subsp. enterica serovar Menston]